MKIVDYTPRLGFPVYGNWKQVEWDEDRWPNFGPHEIRCKGTGRIVIAESALDKLQTLREYIGKPFYVTSGYRSPQYNATLSGAASRSFHMDGIAFDISMANHDHDEFIELAEAFGFDGIGRYQSFVHIDTRGYKARW